MSNVAIDVKNVTKLYKLYDKPSDRLFESLGLSKKKRYHEHYALGDVNFTIHKGDCVGIIGTNGAGKSTILKIITGVLNPTSGSVEIDGRISALLELGAGFNMEYTGIENVYLNGSMIGFSKEEIDERLDDIIAFADIGDFIHQPVKTYSSGMFVRLAFAVAINIDPEILIVDEALSVGDIFFQMKCFKKFEEFKAMGKTILFVSHDLSSIQKYCDRAILLNKGTKLAEGSPKDMIDLYKKVLTGHLDDAVDDAGEDHVPDAAPEDSWKSHYELNPDYQEYGDKEVEIIDYAIIDDEGKYTSTVIKGTKFTFKIKLRANQDVMNPIAAFTIKNVKGVDITGTNTWFEGNDIGAMAAGQEKTVSFCQKLNLQGGSYLVSLGCTRFENDRFDVYHRLYDVCELNVVSDKNTVGFYDMESRVVIEG